MSRKAVTKAQMDRVLDVMAARGLRPAEVKPNPDGSVWMRLTDDSEIDLTSADDAQAEAVWDRALGLR